MHLADTLSRYFWTLPIESKDYQDWISEINYF